MTKRDHRNNRNRKRTEQHSPRRRPKREEPRGMLSKVAIGEVFATLWISTGIEPSRAIKPYEHLLADTIAKLQPKRLLEIGSEVGAVGLAAAQSGWAERIVWVQRDTVGLNAVQRTLAAQPLADYTAILGEGARDAASESFDAVVVHQQPSRKLTETLLRQAISVLEATGVIVLAGDIQLGARTAAAALAELCENVDVTEGGKTGLVAIGRNPHSSAAMSEQAPRTTHEAEIHGTVFQWVTTPGVFSADDLDPATELLLDTVVLPHRGRILDMGCGPGVIGLFAALHMPETDVTMIDTDIAAVRCAEEGIKRNCLTNARVVASDGIEAIERKRFDVVLSNPPVHRAGRRDASLVSRFAEEAARAIGRKGRLWLVTAPTVPLQRLLGELFTEVAVTEDFAQRFRVYDAIRRPRRHTRPDEVAVELNEFDDDIEFDEDDWGDDWDAE